jgi:ABC-2 type transport system ATP-binding protein
VIEVVSLTKRYGSQLAVNEASFSAKPGEILGLLGPNGAGKTTIMRILTGYISATAGEVRLGGVDVRKSTADARRRLGYLPEHASLYAEMRVCEYLRYRATIKGIPKRDRDAKTGKALTACGIASVQDRIIGQLSKGFRQRVSLAATLVHEPEVVILDEPAVGLDPLQQQEIRSLVRELGRARTVLFSTHILSEAETVCDRVVIIDKGRVLADGSPKTLAAELAAQVLVVELQGDIDAVVAALTSVGQTRVTLIERAPISRLRVGADHLADPAVRATISKAITGAGAVILTFGLSSTTLEDVFRQVTNKEEGP